MEWIRDQKDIETVVVDDDDSENFDDTGRQRKIEGTLNKNNSDENSDGSDYSSSSDDEEDTDNFLTDVNGNKIIDGLNTDDKAGSTEVSTPETSNNGEKNDNKKTDGIDDMQGSNDYTTVSDKTDENQQDGGEDKEKEQSTRKRKGKGQEKKENKKAK